MTLLKKSRKMADFSEGGRPRGGRRRRGQPGDQPGLEREGDRPETQLPGGQRQIGEGQRRNQRLHRCGEGTMLLPRCAVIRAMLVRRPVPVEDRSEEHTSELQSLMRISYAVFCLKKKIKIHKHTPY